MKRLKVVHFTQASGGGIDSYLKMYLKYSNKNKFNNVLITTGKNKFTNLDGFYHVNINQSFSPIKLIKYAYIIRKILKKENPDIIYLHSTFGGLIGRIAKIGLNCKVVYNPHGWSFKMDISIVKLVIYKLVEACLSCLTDKFILISQSEYDEARKIYISEEKLELVYNGIDIETLDKPELNYNVLPKGMYIIGMVGRITEQKNPLFFVDFAYEILKRYKNTLFVIVGDGDLRQQVENKIAEYNIKEHFLITGWIDEPAYYIKQFNQAVLFSKWEGFGLSVAEYMLYKKNILITGVDGMLDLIKDNYSGFIINDLNDAVNKSHLLREKKEISDFFSENAYNRVIEKFNIRDKVAKIENIFVELVR